MSENGFKSIDFNKKKLISVVIPVFQNRETLAETCAQVLFVREENFPHLELEIIFVDDGSKDGSWDELLRVQSENQKYVNLVKLSRNFGQVSAILAGYEAARGEAVITLSADLQDPVRIMAQMISHWEKGQEIVIAHRESREDGVMATLFSRVAYGFARKGNALIPAGGFDYLLLSHRAVKLLCSFNSSHRFFQGDVLSIGLPTTFIPYARECRKYGKSGWSFSKKFKYLIDLILDSSYLPIRLMSSMGFLTASVGSAYALLIIYSWCRHQTPFSGWAPIMIILLVVSGLIMMMLGIIGEYIWRIYDDIKQKPLYVVEKKLQTKSFLEQKFISLTEMNSEEA